MTRATIALPVLALVILGLAGCAASGEKRPSAMALNGTVGTGDDPWVCAGEAATGTRLAKPVCKRQSEIKRQELEAKDQLQEWTRVSAPALKDH